MAVACDNRLVLCGRILRRDASRRSPAGIPIERFYIEHRSQQQEAGVPRLARCRIEVMACGETLCRSLAAALPGRMIRAAGFISRADYRQGRERLVLHAEQIELLNEDQ